MTEATQIDEELHLVETQQSPESEILDYFWDFVMPNENEQFLRAWCFIAVAMAGPPPSADSWSYVEEARQLLKFLQGDDPKPRHLKSVK